MSNSSFENVMSSGDEKLASLANAVNEMRNGETESPTISLEEAKKSTSDLQERIAEARRNYVQHHTPIVKWTTDNPKVGRNDPCPCGSGKKYKNCCGK